MKATEDRAAKKPNNPEAHYTMATFYWDEAFRDTSLKENQKKEYLQKGIDEIDKAMQIKPDYTEALVIQGTCSCASRRTWRRTRPSRMSS